MALEVHHTGCPLGQENQERSGILENVQNVRKKSGKIGIIS